MNVDMSAAALPGISINLRILLTFVLQGIEGAPELA